jgi:hypothetical protein
MSIFEKLDENVCKNIVLLGDAVKSKNNLKMLLP